MKKLLFLQILLLVLFSSNAQNYWQKVIDFGPGARSAATSFTINGKGYLVSGQTNTGSVSYFNDTWEYDPVMDAWTQKADLPGSPRSGAASFVINNKAYVGAGGFTGTTLIHFKDFYEYDPQTNIWIQKNDFAGSPRYLGISFAINGKGYFGTGHPGPKDDFWEYNPSTDIWTQVAPFPGGPRQTMAYFSVEDKGYAGTGYSNGTMFVDFWEYDPSTNFWTQKANFGGNPRYGAVGFSLNGNGYIGTGGTGTIFYKDIWKFDPIINSWMPAPQFEGGERYHSSSFVIDSVAYVGTGGTHLTSYKDIWKFTSFAVGLPESDYNNKIYVYPNPATNSISISSATEGKNWKIRVADLKGSIVITKTTSSLNLILDITTLGSGFYILSISDGSSIVHQTKFEKLK